MQFPAVTSGYAAVLALIFVALSGWVIAGRGQFRVNLGDGGQADMNRRIRAHGNFAEYVPLVLLLAALLETSGTSRPTIHVLLLTLVVARILHPIGLVAPEASLQQYACRGGSAVATLLILLIAAVLLLVRVI